MNRKIQRLLIANRGEIACRIIATAKRMGITTLAVFSEADTSARHTQLADEALPIGPAPAVESYLNIDALVQAALASGADAVHPGYGFLSENADFAEALGQHGITFIGPAADAIRLMGDKRLAKQAMLKAGVPTLPGYAGDDQSDQALHRQALHVGFPLMVKAAHGGGGRGMRLVHSEAELGAALLSARSEARNAFGNGALLLEKALLHPRHIEVQIFADSHGQCVYLGERDCSIQRRHQKVVEEAPAAGLSDELRKTLGETAVTAALSANYLGAGTVEFLVQDDAFYFLEMNTRLQVEHPVTERVFGEDLVAWQIAIAEGGPLPKSQTQLQVDGHAIEVRLYAEDPGHGFLPQTGTAHHWRCQNQAHMRTDHMLYDGAQIGNWYDPMLAKLIAWGPTRAEAIQQLNQQLHDTALLGVTHNLGFLTRIIQHPVFQSAPPDTGFLARQQLTEPAGAPHRGLVVAEVLAFLTAQTPTTDWLRGLAHLSLPHTRTWQAGDKIYRVQLDATRWHIGELRIAIDAGQPLTVSRIHYAGHSLRLHLEGRQLTAYAIQRGRRVFVQCNGDHSDYEAQNPLQTTTETPTSDGLSAPMSGQVVAILAADQTTVCAGDTLLVLEAMKMELSVKAHAPGRLTLQCQVGDQVTQGTALARIDPLDEHTAPLQSNPTEAHHDNA